MNVTQLRHSLNDYIGKILVLNPPSRITVVFFPRRRIFFFPAGISGFLPKISLFGPVPPVWDLFGTCPTCLGPVWYLSHLSGTCLGPVSPVRCYFLRYFPPVSGRFSCRVFPPYSCRPFNSGKYRYTNSRNELPKCAIWFSI